MKNHYEMLKKLLLLIAVALFANITFAQQSTITGRVVDSGDGMQIPGVSVTVKGTGAGAITDLDGKYSIQASASDILVFSFMGYTTQEVAVGSNTVIDIALKTAELGLDEVVVIGYGSQKKREVVGSIATVSSKSISSIAAPSFESALQGQASGLQVITGSGMAGSGSVIRVRGISSVSANGDPLYVVDGIPITSDIFIANRGGGMNGNPLNTINPNDIESIQVLKDAAAVGIYGSRGANGVILIETKKGKSGKPAFTFNSKVGLSTYTKKPAMMNAAEWLTMRQEAWENDGNKGVPTQLPGSISWDDAWAYANETGGKGTDWWDEVTRIGIQHSYDLSAKLGGKKYRAFASGAYSHDESYLIRNNFDRFSFRANLEYDILDNLKVGVNSSFSNGINFQAGTPWEGGLGVAMSTALPYFPIKNDDGTWFKAGEINNNPVLVSEYRRIRSQELRSITTAFINYEPIKNLSIKASGGFDYMDYRYEKYEPTEVTKNDYNISYYSPTYVRNMNYSLVATYNWKLNDIHNFTFMLGNEFQYSITEKNHFNFGEDQVIQKPIYEDRNVYKNIVATKDPVQKWSFISYFARVNYNYKSKYLLQATARTDGSSRFGENNRFGFFPTVALGWVASEEEFMKNLAVVSHLKLKASYGVTGNSAIDNYARWGTFVEAQSTNTYNGVPIIYASRLPNPNVKWETVKTYDLGLELNLFKDRIMLETAYYNKNASDIFVLNAGISPSVGIGNFTDNVISVKNTGIELSLTTRNFVSTSDGFTWSTSFNIAKNDNEVTSTGDALPDDIGGGSNDTRVVVGCPIGTNYLVRFWKVDPEDGRPIYLDKDGNATKTFDLDNRVATGSVVPDWVGGFSNNFSFKGIDLSFLFTFSIGGNIYDSSAKRQTGVMGDWNFRKDRFDRWTKPGDEATFPRTSLLPETYGSTDIWMNSTRYLYDASYLRLKNISLGYNFQKDWLKKVKIQSARIYLAATNLLTFTKFPGVDPEIARDFDDNNDRNMSPNISWLTPPQTKSFNFGVEISF